MRLMYLRYSIKNFVKEVFSLPTDPKNYHKVTGNNNIFVRPYACTCIFGKRTNNLKIRIVRPTVLP